MRITFLNGLYPPHGAAGAETTLRFLAGRLAAGGHDCSVVTVTPEPRGSVGEVDGIPVHYLPLANVYWPHGGKRPKALRPVFQALDAFNPTMATRLRATLRTLRPDVLNCHNLQGFSVSAWRAAATLGIPVVQTIHDYYLACPRSAMWRPGRGNCATQCAECRAFSLPRRALSGIPAAITCVSHRVFDRLTQAGMFAAARHGTQPVRIIRGNNRDAIAPRGGAARNDGLTLGFMGRIEPSKGLDALLEAVNPSPSERLRLLVAGTGEPGYLQRLRANAGGGQVQFLGHVRPEDFFPGIDCLVIPSAWEDPFPRVFHEALAFGVPALVTPLGGLPEVIRPGQTGFIAAGSDAASLREAIGRLLDPHWDREAMRRACLDAAAAYAPDRIVAQYRAVLHAAATGAAVPDDAGEVWRPRRAAAGTATLEVARHGA